MLLQQRSLSQNNIYNNNVCTDRQTRGSLSTLEQRSTSCVQVSLSVQSSLSKVCRWVLRLRVLVQVRLVERYRSRPVRISTSRTRAVWSFSRSSTHIDSSLALCRETGNRCEPCLVKHDLISKEEILKAAQFIPPFLFYHLNSAVAPPSGLHSHHRPHCCLVCVE